LRWGAATAFAGLIIAGGWFYAHTRSPNHEVQQAALERSVPAPQSAPAAANPETPASREVLPQADQAALNPPRVNQIRSAAKKPVPVPAHAARAENSPASDTEIAGNEEPAAPRGTGLVSESADMAFSKAKEPQQQNTQQSPAGSPPSPVSPQLTGPAGMMVYGANVPRWRVSTSGDLQRSFDVESWQNLKVGNKVVFRTVASSGKDVWAGGNGGALYHSPDAGNRWVQVTPAANSTTLTTDITDIQFTDANHLRLTTSSGAVWTSPDSGATWQVQ